MKEMNDMATLEDLIKSLSTQQFVSAARAVFNLVTTEKVKDPQTGKIITQSRKVPQLVTKVEFEDGTYTIVKNSIHDPVSLVDALDEKTKKPLGFKIADDCAKETAIAYAWFKRCFGAPNPKNPNEWISAGCGGRLRKFAQEGFDQQYEAVMNPIREKRRTEANREQTARKEALEHDRKVKRLAKQILLENEAVDLAKKALELTQPSKSKNACSCGTCSCTGQPNEKTANQKPIELKAPIKTDSLTNSDEYVRPNKPFSQFTQEEKREYWREQKRRLSK